MGNKIWYILEQDHHLGPFTSADVSTRFKQNKLSQHSQIWREGLDSWLPLYKVEEFSSLFSRSGDVDQTAERTKDLLGAPTPPPKPEEKNLSEYEPPSLKSRTTAVMADDELKTINKIKKVLDVVDGDDLLLRSKKLEAIQVMAPPPLPDSELPPPPTKEILEEEALEDEIKENQASILMEMPRPLKKKSSFVWLWIIALPTTLLLISFAVFLFALFYQGPVTLPANIAPEYRASLEPLLKDGERSYLGSAIAVAPSLSGREVLVSSNYAGKLLLELKLDSVAGKIANNQTVKAEMSGTLDRQVGSLSRFKLLEGADLSPGYYQFILTGKKVDGVANFLFRIKELPIIAPLLGLDTFEGEIKLRGTLFLAAIPEVRFNRMLKDMQKKKQAELLAPLAALLPHIETLTTLMERTILSFETHLAKAKTGQGVNPFERAYLAEIPTQLDLFAVKLTDAAPNESMAEFTAMTRDLTDLAKDFDLKVKERVKTTRPLPALSGDDKRDLILQFSTDIGELKAKAAAIEKQIKELIGQ